MKFKKKLFKDFKKIDSISFSEVNSKKSISYQFSLPNTLSEKTLRKLKSLTLRTGAMKNQLNSCLNDNDQGIVLIAEHKLFGIVGWALIFEDNFYKIPIYFYVSSAFRRQGIGTNLLTLGKKIIRKKLKGVEEVYPHDTRSTRFFDKVYFKGSNRNYY